MLRNILVPIDGSENALDAVRFAADLAEQTQAVLTILHVFDASAIALMGMTALTGREVDDAVSRVSSSYLEGAKKALEGKNVEVRTVSRVGNPAGEIVTFAETNDIGMVIIGSRGQSTMRGLLVGSVSDQVVHTAKVPVTVIRPKQ